VLVNNPSTPLPLLTEVGVGEINVRIFNALTYEGIEFACSALTILVNNINNRLLFAEPVCLSIHIELINNMVTWA